VYDEARTLSAVIFAGAIGGFISAQRRIQGVTDHGESLVGLIELSTLSSFFGNMGPPIMGAIFAVVLYAIFGSGLLKEEVFPTIATCKQPGIFFGSSEEFVGAIRFRQFAK
jgi:hypothetical protein